MSERNLAVYVALARERITALRARLAPVARPAAVDEATTALDDIRELLDELNSRHGLLREVLDRTRDIILAKGPRGRYQMLNERATLVGKSILEVNGSEDTAQFDTAVAERFRAVDREVKSNGRHIERGDVRPR